MKNNKSLEVKANKLILELGVCKHDEYCNVKYLSNKIHCSKEFEKNCQTAKFYRRYPGWYQLEIGS